MCTRPRYMTMMPNHVAPPYSYSPFNSSHIRMCTQTYNTSHTNRNRETTLHTLPVAGWWWRASVSYKFGLWPRTLHWQAEQTDSPSSKLHRSAQTSSQPKEQPLI